MRPFTRGQLAGLRLIRQAEADAARAVAEREAAPVVPQAVLIAMLDNIEDELRDCTAGLEREPTLRDDLIAIADRLNHVVTSLEVSPATPREPAIAAPTGETEEVWPVRDVLAKLADATDHLLRDHDCDTHGHEEFAAARDAARSMLAAPVLPVDSVYLAWLTPLLRDLRDAVSTQDVRRAKHAIELAVHHHLSPAALSAPQEPRVEPSEGMATVSVVPPREPQAIQSPSKCTSCGARSHSTTTGMDLDRCDRCGGTMVHECGPECPWHRAALSSEARDASE